MKRYFTLTFSALNKGLDRLKTQLGSSASSSDAPVDSNHTQPHATTSAAAQISPASSNQQAKAIDDIEDLVPGVRYLQNYSAVKLQEIVSRVMAEVTSEQDEHTKTAELHTLETTKQQSKDFQTSWLQDLIAKVAAATDTSKITGEIIVSSSANIASVGTLSSSANLNSIDTASEDNLESTRSKMLEIFTIFSSLTTEFNTIISKSPELSKLRISTTEISSVSEKDAATYLRCRTSSASWSLNIRGSAALIEIFLVPAAEIFLLSQAETAMRLKNVLRLFQNTQNQSQKHFWSIDGLTTNSDELQFLARNLFKQLLLATVQEAQDEMPAASILQNLEGEELRDAVNQIILAEQNMAQKIVSQQEEIQHRIARDLHDAVIADIMSLKRVLSGDQRLDNEEVVENLDHICTRLREICHDLAPRDLKDWGLQTVIEDLVERLAHRTGADCSFTCNGELPELPYPVQLHIYRIVQESLNNMEKYARASKIVVKFEVTGKDIKITMRDNGQGFSTSADGTNQGAQRSKKEGGTGLSGIKERTEMIRCFFKTQLSVSSVPGEGSETILEVKT